MKPVELRILRPVGVAGVHHAPGITARLSATDALALIELRAAELIDPTDLRRLYAARAAEVARLERPAPRF